MNKYKRNVILFAFITFNYALNLPLFAQTRPTDTVKLTVKQAEDLFLKNNLTLIAQRYNIDIASAQVLTARLFPNPDFSFSNGLYGSDTSRGYHSYKEKSFNVSQLFTTAGKRNKNIRLQQIGVEQARYQFFDLIRTLKFTLRSDFYSLYYNRQSARVYDLEIGSLGKTMGAYKEQYAKGNIAAKELLRIQAQLYSLQAEYSSLLTGIDTTESDLRMMLHLPPGTAIAPQLGQDSLVKDHLAGVPYERLLDSAYVNRYDLKYSKTTVEYNNLNLALQKATAVPDFSLSVNYDRLGSYGQNFLSGGVGFSLPFFNRNQGNIKQARLQVDQSKVQLQNTQNQVENDVASNYKTALRLEKLYSSFDPQFKQDFTHLIGEVYKNFEKRNISMLEFLDYYESYKANTLQLNNVILSHVTALEQLNFVTGTSFFNQ
jgi:cobalt-zinc-cadmium efflux system outer membrane protein